MAPERAQSLGTTAPFDIKLSGTLPTVRKASGELTGLVVLDKNARNAGFEAIVRSLQSTAGTQGSVVRANALSSDVIAAPSLLPAPDLMWHNSADGGSTIWRMNGSVFSGTGSLVAAVASPWKFVAVGDMNNDSNPDFIWEETASGIKAVIFMNGPNFNGNVGMMVQIPIAWRIAAAADMNGDGKTDLIVENTTTGEHIALFMNGAAYAGSQAPLLQLAVTWRLAAVADVNGDGKQDLIWENKSDGTRVVTMYNGVTYTGVTQTLGVLPVAWEIGAAGDWNGDSQTDLMVQNTTDGQRRIYYMQGTSVTGQFATLPTVATSYRVVGAGRVNWNPAGDKTVSDVAGLRSAVANATPNSRIFVAAGTYDLGGTSLKIDGKSNLQIIGAGRGLTVLKANASALWIVELAGAITNLSISHMTLEGTVPLTRISYGLAMGYDRYSLSGGRFFDLEIKNVSVGIQVANSSLGACTDVEIVGNYLDNIQDFPDGTGGTSGSGYGIFNESCVNLRIADNVIRNVDRHAIYQAKANQGDRPGFGKIVIEHNLIIDHARTSSLNADWLVALVVARSANVVVSNNVIVNAYHIALSIENEAVGAPQWNVTDVRLINNTVLGARDYDVYFSASGPFTFWGNRFYHRDGSATNVAKLAQVGYGLSGTLVEPTGLTGTQEMAAADPYTSTYALRTGVLQKLTTTYNTDPATWALANSPFLVTGFEDMAAAPGLVYLVANRKLTEVNPITWIRRDSPLTFPAASMVGYSEASGLVAVSNGQIYRLNSGTLDGSPAGLPGTGPIRGMAVFGDKTYVMSGSCYYELRTSDLTVTNSAC
ncbi:MAG TPA: VCBS repeat-containing protein [Gemmatimonadaceae bacterium]|nr:VCBS repeat-containing protein [Gemmatimonadaceae bacterium]